MPRKYFKRWLPDPADFRNRPALAFMSNLLHDPNLFHLNRHSVSVAFLIGLFIAFLPIPGQMPLAALFAFWLRCNMPLAVALVWISNPLTMPPLFYATYELGRWLLGSPKMAFTIELSWEWLNTEFTRLWEPLLVGSVLTGVVMGTLGYVSIQLFWRWHVVRSWERRKLRREQARHRSNG
ncbi:DUF2062 domain-containing protein [Pseudomaricurvus sp. HS19]|uniref:DUF2062 domain-containing protein n=1 Tax=Pseudomaricurvus sp. HS19 TaxID=2692626 RepID=UPI00136C7A2D|nr:DUF2062 domain-containing protein [Pseudomaricurvus sp. HS19]MYM62710.1 DUF2062 domain-containing protein [Pseudomaricurvus sp. HS19]